VREVVVVKPNCSLMLCDSVICTAFYLIIFFLQDAVQKHLPWLMWCFHSFILPWMTFFSNESCHKRVPTILFVSVESLSEQCSFLIYLSISKWREACSIRKTDLDSLDFVVNRFFMKLFHTDNIDTIKECQMFFLFSLKKRVEKFQKQYQNHQNTVCQIVNNFKP